MSYPFRTASAVHDTLVAVFADLDAIFQRPPEILARRADYPDSWSINEHLEHVSLVNHFLLLTIRKGCVKALQRAATQPAPEGESDLQRLAPIAVPGAFDWPPPLHMLPSGNLPPEEIRALLQRQRRTCLELLASLPAGAGRLCTIRMSVHDLGRLDMYQWLYFLAKHASYHLTLIDRIPR